MPQISPTKIMRYGGHVLAHSFVTSQALDVLVWTEPMQIIPGMHALHIAQEVSRGSVARPKFWVEVAQKQLVGGSAEWLEAPTNPASSSYWSRHRFTSITSNFATTAIDVESADHIGLYSGQYGQMGGAPIGYWVRLVIDGSASFGNGYMIATHIYRMAWDEKYRM